MFDTSIAHVCRIAPGARPRRAQGAHSARAITRTRATHLVLWHVVDLRNWPGQKHAEKRKQQADDESDQQPKRRAPEHQASALENTLRFNLTATDLTATDLPHTLRAWTGTRTAETRPSVFPNVAPTAWPGTVSAPGHVPKTQDEIDAMTGEKGYDLLGWDGFEAIPGASNNDRLMFLCMGRPAGADWDNAMTEAADMMEAASNRVNIPVEKQFHCRAQEGKLYPLISRGISFGGGQKPCSFYSIPCFISSIADYKTTFGDSDLDSTSHSLASMTGIHVDYANLAWGCSFTQYTARGLFRCADNGGRTDDEFEATVTAQEKQARNKQDARRAIHIYICSGLNLGDRFLLEERGGKFSNSAWVHPGDWIPNHPPLPGPWEHPGGDETLTISRSGSDHSPEVDIFGQILALPPSSVQGNDSNPPGCTQPLAAPTDILPALRPPTHLMRPRCRPNGLPSAQTCRT
ncbi:hypothetical protein C8F01DRAFT_1343459 [Mycena amicta]|nr:hypothetical protein C8F01DRAFT_1343459 [Mycena amicta]